jgi:glucose-6-phosphate 1-epimerase
MEIELWSGNTKAIIDPKGAWMTNLSDDRGDILFPRRMLKAVDGASKVRGGCHVCLPNFGPGGASSQPQHGFGREMLWKEGERSDSSVRLILKRGRDEYENLSSFLTYQLESSRLDITLKVINNGGQPLRVGPAFHPYFAIQGAGDFVKINGTNQPLEDLNDTLFVSGGAQELILPNRTVMLHSKGLLTWAQWTDRLGSYVCIEPTVGGYTFLNETSSADEILAPNQQKIYKLTISW